MSEGIDAYIKKKFEVPDVDIRTYSPLTLAYIGDGVFDLVIRSVVVGKGNYGFFPVLSDILAEVG